MEKSSIMKQVVKRIGKNDMIFIGVLLMVGIAVLFAFLCTGRREAAGLL